MNNRLGDAPSVLYTNAGSAISSGDVVIMGDTIGVALVDIAASTGVGQVAIEGEFALTALTGAVIAVGERVMWDATGSAFDDSAATAATGDIVGGAIATGASGNGDVVVNVRLTPGGAVTA